MLHIALERLEPDDDDDDDDDDDEEEEEQEGRQASEAPASKRRRLEVQEKKAKAEATKATVIEMIKTLVERGVDVNALDGDGRAPIHQAASYGAADVAKVLLEADADPTVQYRNGRTVLHEATIKGDTKMIELLLAAPTADGAVYVPPHVDTPGPDGWTPLCLAVRNNNLAVAKALIGGGADPSFVTGKGKSALDLAKLNKRAALLELFGEWDAGHI